MATGNFLRVAERAGGRGPTVRVPGVAAAAATAAAALATARRSRESSYTGACFHGSGVFDAVARVGGSERLRGGRRWAGPALAVTHGHAGAGAGPGEAWPLLLSSSVTF